jgi:Ca2+/H+ antiporter
MSVITILIPAGFHATSGALSDALERADILKVSRGASIILLLIYAGYLVCASAARPRLLLRSPLSQSNSARTRTCTRMRARRRRSLSVSRWPSAYSCFRQFW